MRCLCAAVFGPAIPVTRTSGLHLFLPWQPEAMAADCLPSACDPIQQNASCIGFTALALIKSAGLRVCVNCGQHECDCSGTKYQVKITAVAIQ